MRGLQAGALLLGSALYFLIISQGFLLKFSTQLLSWPPYTSVSLTCLHLRGSSALPMLHQALVQEGFVPPPCCSPVLPGAGGHSCCPMAGKCAPLRGGVGPSVAAGAWGLPYVLGTLPRIINQGGQSSPALQQGKEGLGPLSCPLLVFGYFPPGRQGDAGYLGGLFRARGGAEPHVWALGLAESPSLPFLLPTAPCCSELGPVSLVSLVTISSLLGFSPAPENSRRKWRCLLPSLLPAPSSGQAGARLPSSAQL